MSDKLDFYLKNTSFECPICHYHSGKLWEVVNPPKNGGPSRVGHIFVSCSNRADACRATTFFGPNPPTISSIGTIGNRKIGIWKAWSPQDGPKRLPEDTNDTYVRPVATGKRKRSSAAEEEEEEERPVKRRRQDTETDAKVKYLEEQLLKLTSKQQPSKKKSPPKKPAPVEDSIEEEEEDLEEGEIKAPYTQYSPEVTDELEDEVNTRSYEEVSGIKNYISSKQFSEKLEQLKLAKIKVARPSPPDPYLSTYGMFTNPARAILEKRLIKAGLKRVDCRMDLARLRSVKQKIELEAIQQAIDITIESLKSIKKKLSSQKSELELSNYLLAEFLKRGANGVAFESVIASAKNAATIHHRASDQPVKNDSLLLLDVGAEFSNYAADISRTWVIGEVAAKQLKCKAAVKEVQDFAFSLLRPGIFLRDYASQVRKFAADCYKQNRLIEHKQQIDEVLPHAISHFLGLDVHDAGDYERPLEENMVLTVEPGIYLPAERIGVRIEDDVLITKTGARWLSK
jgi:Xaa-Pro aminopeptidase